MTTSHIYYMYIDIHITPLLWHWGKTQSLQHKWMSDFIEIFDFTRLPLIDLTRDSLERVFEERTRRNVQTILQFEGHSLSDVFTSLKRAWRDWWGVPKYSKDPFILPFIPSAVKRLNDMCNCIVSWDKGCVFVICSLWDFMSYIYTV